MLLYASETWVLTIYNEHVLGAFERKILRKIYGPINEGGVWRKRSRKELYNLLQDMTIIQKIKIRRLKWAGHVVRMNHSNPVKCLLLYNPKGKRRLGRPRLRWEEDVKEDAKRAGILDWRMAAMDRDRWRRILKKARIESRL